MLILGIDPGSRKTGFGLIKMQGYHPRYVGSGVIRVEKFSVAERLKRSFESMQEVIQTYQPDVVVIEKMYVYKNPQTAIVLGQARGVLVCAAALMNMPMYEYTPTQIKGAVVGKGHANKSQVNYMVQQLLKLPQAPQEDAADALACALCHERQLSFGLSVNQYQLQ